MRSGIWMFRRLSSSSEVPLCPQPLVAVYWVLTVAWLHIHMFPLYSLQLPCEVGIFIPADTCGHWSPEKWEKLLKGIWWVQNHNVCSVCADHEGRFSEPICSTAFYASFFPNVYFTDFLTRLWATSRQNWILSLDTWSLGQCLTQSRHPRNIGRKGWKEGGKKGGKANYY